MNATAALIADLDRLAKTVRNGSPSADITDIAAQAAQLAEIVSRIAATYDSLAEFLYVDGCPGRHASDDFALAADHVHAAGAACRHAHQTLLEALDGRGWR